MQVKDECCNDCCCAWAARRAERFGLALNFWLHLLLQGKRWNGYSARSADAGTYKLTIQGEPLGPYYNVCV